MVHASAAYSICCSKSQLIQMTSSVHWKLLHGPFCRLAADSRLAPLLIMSCCSACMAAGHVGRLLCCMSLSMLTEYDHMATAMTPMGSRSRF